MSHADDEIRHQLLEHGDDGRTPRHTMFFFYEGNLQALQEVARANDFSVRRMVDGEGLILEKVLPVDEVNFDPVSAMMDSWAQQFGADFDGWECAVAAGV
jgi:hypothetical protein